MDLKSRFLWTSLLLFCLLGSVLTGRAKGADKNGSPKKSEDKGEQGETIEMKDLKQWCLDQEKDCNDNGCNKCCKNAASKRCKDAKTSGGTIGSSLKDLCQAQQKKCEEDSCTKCCDVANTPGCQEKLNPKKLKPNSLEWCEEEKRKCEDETEPCQECCKRSKKKACQKLFGGITPTSDPATKTKDRKACLQAKRGCVFKKNCKKPQDCCADAKEPECVEIIENYCAAGAKKCQESDEKCRQDSPICQDTVKPWCEKQKVRCENQGCQSCCKIVSQKRCMKALTGQDLEKVPEPTEKWCTRQNRRCKGGCKRCCDAAEDFNCPALSEEDAKDIEPLEEPEEMEGVPNSRVTESIGDINDAVRGIKAMEKMSEPFVIRGKDGGEKTLKLHTVEELQRIVGKKNQIKVALAANLGLDLAPNVTDDDSIFFASDMMLSESQASEILRNLKESTEPLSARAKRKVQSEVTTRWGPVVPYVFDAFALNDPNLLRIINEALDFWESNTCIKFENMNPEDAEQEDGYIVFIRSKPGCASYKGMVGGPQEVYMGFGCENFGVATHEIGHALGLWHEHQRSDRDQYVEIRESHIKPKKLDNFYVCKNETECLSTVPFDYGSVMHYHAFAFSVDGEETLKSKDPEMQLTMGARRLGPSFYDVKQINDAYQCEDKCPGPKIACQNGGIPNSRRFCIECICPVGFEGSTCEIVKRGDPAPCGGILFAFDEWQDVSSPLYPDVYPLQQECNWVIQATPGWNVEFEFTEPVFELLESIPCEYNFVEVRSGTDLRNTGPRFCGSTRPQAPFLSESNKLILILKATDEVDTLKGFKGRFRRTGGEVPSPGPLPEETTDGGDYVYEEYEEYEYNYDTTLEPEATTDATVEILETTTKEPTEDTTRADSTTPTTVSVDTTSSTTLAQTTTEAPVFTDVVQETTSEGTTTPIETETIQARPHGTCDPQFVATCESPSGDCNYETTWPLKECQICGFCAVEEETTSSGTISTESTTFETTTPEDVIVPPSPTTSTSTTSSTTTTTPTTTTSTTTTTTPTTTTSTTTTTSSTTTTTPKTTTSSTTTTTPTTTTSSTTTTTPTTTTSSTTTTTPTTTTSSTTTTTPTTTTSSTTTTTPTTTTFSTTTTTPTTTTSTTTTPTTTSTSTTTTTPTTTTKSTTTTSFTTTSSTTTTTTPTTTTSTTSTASTTTTSITSTTATTTTTTRKPTTTTPKPTTTTRKPATTTPKPTTTTRKPTTTTPKPTTTTGLGLITNAPTTTRPTTTTRSTTVAQTTLDPRCTSRSWRRLISSSCESPSGHCLQIRKTSRNYQRCIKCGKCQTKEPGVCPEGFDSSDSPVLCFKRASIRSGSWEEAKTACINMGGFLPSFIDRPESNIFASYARSISVPYAWVGLRDTDSDKGFKGETWDDGSAYVDYNRNRLIRTVWEPKNRRRTGGCAQIQSRRRRLNFSSCNYKYPVICQYRIVD